MLHLEGEANIWWFSHLSHARVTAFAYFTQRLIKEFDKNKSEEKKPSPPLEETCISADTTMEEQPSSSSVGEPITLEEGTLVAVQDVPKLYQGMNIFPLPIISAHHMEDCGYMPSGQINDLGSKHIVDLEQ